MKWCEVDSARLPLLHARRYPAITSKNRRRNAVMALQDTKSRIGAMHHQFYINYANVQGCRINVITVIIWSLIFDLSIAKDKIVFFFFVSFFQQWNNSWNDSFNSFNVFRICRKQWFWTRMVNPSGGAGRTSCSRLRWIALGTRSIRSCNSSRLLQYEVNINIFSTGEDTFLGKVMMKNSYVGGKQEGKKGKFL